MVPANASLLLEEMWTWSDLKRLAAGFVSVAC